MTINLNTNPYYDDFDATKNYVKILFKPGYAVQARELTQLQSALQNQISKFGSHIFKDGSIVLGGKSFQTPVYYIDVEVTLVAAQDFLGLEIIGESSTATGQVVAVELIDTTTTRVYYVSTNGAFFDQAEDIVLPNNDAYPIIDEAAYFGSATTFSIQESVFFSRGYFVYCEPQTIVLFSGSTDTSVRVGLNVSETIVTYSDDSTLLDPAQGSYNYAAPGADRLAVTLTLGKFAFNPQDETATDTADFIEVARFVDGELIYQITTASYSDLETTFARRTYDESGDYTVRAFGMKVIDHIYDDGDFLSLKLDPGKAYVKGYEFETIAPSYIDLEKARDYIERSGRQVQADHGQYFLIQAPTTNLIDFTDNVSITIKDSGGNSIGTAKVRGILKEASAKFKMFVYSVSLNAGKSVANVHSFSAGTGWVANEWHSHQGPVQTPVLYKSYRRPYIVPLPNTVIRSLLDGGVSDTQYTAHKAFKNVYIAGSSVTINTGSVDEVFLSVDSNDYYVVNQTGGAEVSVTSVTGSGSSRTINIGTTNVTVDIYTFVGVSAALQRNKTLETGSLDGLTITKQAISLDTSDCFKLDNVFAYDSGISATITYLGELASVDDLDAIVGPTAADAYLIGGYLYVYDGADFVVGGKDFTKYFTFDTGQKDELYDHGSITMKPGTDITLLTGDYDKLDVEFQYFSHSSVDGFFSVDSYTGEVDYTEIPAFTSSTGLVYNLRDCLDFRPIRTNGAATVTGKYAVVSDSITSSDYTYYLPRKDRLVLTPERKFIVVQGVPSETPVVPIDNHDAMTLYTLDIPAYTNSASDVTFSYVDNRRYTMRDIGKIEKRVERMEYYTSLSLLEKQSSDEVYLSGAGIEKFKNGILVDPFAGHGVGDVANRDYSCAIDPEKRILRPRFSPHSFGFNPTAFTNLTRQGDLVYLTPTGTETLLEQPYVTNYVNLNPYLVFEWNGTMVLTPATDTWVDTTVTPDVTVNMNGANDVYTVFVDDVTYPSTTGVRWNDWQTVNRGVTVTDNYATNSATANSTLSGGYGVATTTATTTNSQTTTTTDTLLRQGIEIEQGATQTVVRDLGSKVVDTSLVPFIRTQVIKFAAQGLKPNTGLSAMFDGRDVSLYCHPATELAVTALNETTVKGATKVRKQSDATTEASVLLIRDDRAFIVPDAQSTLIANGNTLQWLLPNGTWVLSGTAGAQTHPLDLYSNADGDCCGTFNLPNDDVVKFSVGERAFRLADSLAGRANTAAEAKFIAQGLSQSVQRTLVATQVATVSVAPVQQYSETVSTENKNIVVSVQQTNRVVTPPAPIVNPTRVACAGTVNGNGRLGRFQYTLDMSSWTGACGINFTATAVPCRYTLLWNGVSVSSGFVGSASYNSDLNTYGYPNVSDTVLGAKTLRLNKNTASPTTATLVIDAPLSTPWAFTSVCPPVPQPIPYSLTISPSPAQATWEYSLGQPGSAHQITARVTGGSGSSFRGRVTFTVSAPGVESVSITSPIFVNNNSSASTTLSLQDTIGMLGTNTPVRISASVIEVNGSNTPTIDPATSGNITASAQTTISITPTLTDTQSWQVDPVAQTFFVNAAQYPNGLYLSAIDLYFKSKSASVPVTVQIRPVVNGYPSSSVVVPFGLSTKQAREILTSADGKTATRFTFNNLIHLAPGEYSFVALANSSEYEIWTARIGEFDMNTQQRVVDQPANGSMFKSQNASTWTAEQMEDVKFKLIKHIFPVSTTGTVTSNAAISASHGNVDYDTFFATGEMVKFGSTTIKSYFKMTGDANWTQYQLGSNLAMGTSKTLLAATPSSLQFKNELVTTDKNVTPLVDLNRLSCTLVGNIVNTYSVVQVTLTATTDLVFMSGHGYEDGDLVYFNSVTDDTDVQAFTPYYVVYEDADNFKLALDGALTPIDLSIDTTAVLDTSGEQKPFGGNCKGRYITRKVKLNPEFESRDMKVYLLANVPSTTAIEVYYKVSAVSDENFDDNSYHKMSLEYAGTYTETGFAEYRYKTPYVDAGENVALPTADAFDTFAVKIVMLSSDRCKVPQIKDLRVIAFDE